MPGRIKSCLIIAAVGHSIKWREAAFLLLTQIDSQLQKKSVHRLDRSAVSTVFARWVVLACDTLACDTFRPGAEIYVQSIVDRRVPEAVVVASRVAEIIAANE